MEPINVRLYHGGDFVTKNWKTTYEGGGISLHVNEEEVCYFEIVGWIEDLGYTDPGKIWYRRHGCSMFAGMKEMKDDKDLTDLLGSPEKDGFFHLYVVHEKKGESSTHKPGGLTDLTKGNNGVVGSGINSHKKMMYNAESSCILGGPPSYLSLENVGLHIQSSQIHHKPVHKHSKKPPTAPVQPKLNKSSYKPRSELQKHPNKIKPNRRT